MAITTRPKEDQNFWNFLLSLVFALLFALSAREIYLTRGGYPIAVSFFDAVLIALAIFRLTRLVVYDKITRFAREWFVQKREITRGDGVVMIEMQPHPRGLRRTIGDLLGCPWCIGVWAALLVVFCYFEYPWAWYVIFVLAVAGIGSALQITANLIGWSAERSKLSAHAMHKESETQEEKC